MFRSPLKSMWDPPIHPSSKLSVLAGTYSLSQIDVRPPNPPPSGPSVLADTQPHVHPFWAQPPCWHSFPFSNRCGTPQSTHFWDPASLLTHRLMSTPFWAQPPRWHIARCLALLPFVTAKAIPLADIALF